MLVLILFSYALYLGAIEQARAWGDLVKGAFDLSVGPSQTDGLSRSALRHGGGASLMAEDFPADGVWSPLEARLPQYRVPSTSAHGEPSVNHGRLKLTKEIAPPNADGVVAVTLKVKNRKQAGLGQEGARHRHTAGRVLLSLGGPPAKITRPSP